MLGAQCSTLKPQTREHAGAHANNNREWAHKNVERSIPLEIGVRVACKRDSTPRFATRIFSTDRCSDVELAIEAFGLQPSAAVTARVRLLMPSVIASRSTVGASHDVPHIEVCAGC